MEMASDKYASLCSRLQQILPSFFKCDVVPTAGVRVRTPVLFPDGGVIDVFVVEVGNGYLVTDFGGAYDWLRSMCYTYGSYEDRFREVCSTLGVELVGHQVMLRVRDEEELPVAVLNVAQAALRMADVWYFLHDSSSLD